MQLANVARHSRRCARGTIERTSRRRPLSSTSIAASGDQASWVVTPLPGSSSLVEPQSLPTKLEPPNESCSSNGSGSNSSSRSNPSADFSASSVDTERQRVQNILDAYTKSSCTWALPSLANYVKISDDVDSHGGLWKRRKKGREGEGVLLGAGEGEGGGGGGAPEAAKRERGCETPRVGGSGGVLGEALGPVGLRLSSTGDDEEEEEEEGGRGEEEGASSLEGGGLNESLELGNELMLSKLLVGLHRRVKLKRKNCFPLTPMSPQQRDIDSKLLGQEALDYFKRIRSLGAYPPWPMCSLLVQLLASEGMLEEADEQFADILAHGVLPTESCATMMIRLRVQRGKIAEAMEILEMMEGREYQQKFCRPRFRSYQPVICELLRRGDMDGVMKLWKHMQWQNILPKILDLYYADPAQPLTTAEESFLLDLMAGVASCHENASGDDLTRLADQLLDGVSKTLIYPSAPTVKALREGWRAEWTDLSEQGTCTVCGEKLQGVGLSPADRTRMRSSIVQIAAQNGAAEVQRLSWFANWFDSLEEPPTAIIDGPNAAYMDQNHKHGGFTLMQVDWLAEHLRSKGERVLITMPWFYCKQDSFQLRTWRGKQPPRKRPWTSLEKGIIQKWMENDWLVIVEGLDDLYWMYSTIARDDVNTVVVTNDLMRDHRNFFPGTREFVRWKRSHMVSFSFEWDKGGPLAWAGGKSETGAAPPPIKLQPGASWEEVQRTGANWHLPVRVSHNESPGKRGDAGSAKSCLCVPMPTSSSAVPSSSDTGEGGPLKPFEEDGAEEECRYRRGRKQFTPRTDRDLDHLVPHLPL